MGYPSPPPPPPPPPPYPSTAQEGGSPNPDPGSEGGEHTTMIRYPPYVPFEAEHLPTGWRWRYAPPDPEEGQRDSSSRTPEGPSWKGWVLILTVCTVGGWLFANYVYNRAVERDRSGTPAPSASSELVALEQRAEFFSLNPFKTFTSAGVAGVKGVSQCDESKYLSCATGIISGLFLTAAGLWAPIPSKQSAQKFGNLSISFNQFDESSNHPAHQFIANYRDVINRNPSYESRIGAVHYTSRGPSRHRLVISPPSTGIGRRQDGRDNDGGTVSYEWGWVPSDKQTTDISDFGGDDNGVDKTKEDYDTLAGGVAGYLEENKANNICVTQCIGSRPYEIGQLQTQAGTDPAYDHRCEESADMDECT